MASFFRYMPSPLLLPLQFVVSHLRFQVPFLFVSFCGLCHLTSCAVSVRHIPPSRRRHSHVLSCFLASLLVSSPRVTLSYPISFSFMLPLRVTRIVRPVPPSLLHACFPWNHLFSAALLFASPVTVAYLTSVCLCYSSPVPSRHLPKPPSLLHSCRLSYATLRLPSILVFLFPIALPSRRPSYEANLQELAGEGGQQ